MDLYKHQEEFLMKMPRKHLCCWDMGTGKTRLSIEWAKKLEQKPLIIVPKGLVDNWVRECKTWGLDGYTLITKEKFRSLAHSLGKYDTIIVDEMHYFAGKSLMNKSLQNYVANHQPKNILGLTGTPYLRNAWNVYRLGLILGANKLDGIKSLWTWYWFDMRFFTRVRMGQRIIPVAKTDEGTKKILANFVNKIGSTKHLDECADVPISQEYPELVERTKEQDDFVADMTDIEPIVRYTKEQQAMGGVVKGDAYTPQAIVKSNKLERLMQIVGHNDKIMVVCRYIHELEYLKTEIEKTGRSVFVLQGSVKDRDGIVQKARKSEEAVLLVGAQISEGWEAPEFETMVFYSHSFSLKDYVQMKGRIQRINNLRPRCYVHLLVKDSVDEAVYRSLLNKSDFLAHIYDKERTKYGKEGSKTNSKTA
jgi:superfamily II DNA or RNA helicase